MTDTTREIVRGYFDAWTSGDLGRARELLADDRDGKIAEIRLVFDATELRKLSQAD
jgi:hypothetical protein